MAEVTDAPSGPTTSAPAFIPVPLHFLSGGVLLVLLGGPERLHMAIIEAGPIVYLGLAAALGAAVVNTLLLAKLGRGGDVPVALPVALALAPWLLGIVGTLLGLLNVARAVEAVNPADKATILAAGFAEAINNRMIGAWFSAAQLAAVAIGLGLIAVTRAGEKKNGAAALVAIAAGLAFLAGGAAVTVLGGKAVAAMLLPCVALGAALLFGGLGANGEERNLGVIAAAGFAGAASVSATSVMIIANGTTQMFSAIGSVGPSDKLSILALGAAELAQGQLFLRVGALIAFAGAAALIILAQRRVPGANPMAFILPAVLAAGMVVLDLGVARASGSIASSPKQASLDVEARDLVIIQSHSGSAGARALLTQGGELEVGPGQRISLDDSAAVSRALLSPERGEFDAPGIAIERGTKPAQLLALLTAVHLAGADGVSLIGRASSNTEVAQHRDSLVSMFPFLTDLATNLSELPVQTRGYVTEERRVSHRGVLGGGDKVSFDSVGGDTDFTLPTTQADYSAYGALPDEVRRGQWNDLVELEVGPDASLEQLIATTSNLWALNYRVLLVPASAD